MTAERHSPILRHLCGQIGTEWHVRPILLNLRDIHSDFTLDRLTAWGTMAYR